MLLNNAQVSLLLESVLTCAKPYPCSEECKETCPAYQNFIEKKDELENIAELEDCIYHKYQKHAELRGSFVFNDMGNAICHIYLYCPISEAYFCLDSNEE
jgi:hypothetical protein